MRTWIALLIDRDEDPEVLLSAASTESAIDATERLRAAHSGAELDDPEARWNEILDDDHADVKMVIVDLDVPS